ncbi:MAG: FAD-dependent oxidoreductase [Gemmatimonadales bacterium]|nr:FAD-dependent oxidoreductase [Gemmatimonadales bacterium]
MPDRPQPSPLTERQRTVLAAVCETLLPSLVDGDDPHGLFALGAADAGTVARVERLIAAIADPDDRRRLGLLLSALGSPVASLATIGRPVGFARLSSEQRERALRAWAHSSIPLRRAGFQALKRLCHVSYLAWPARDGTHPAWQAVGYPGPLPPPAAGTEPLREAAVESDAVLDCEVLVIGSGAGGGLVAGELAASGRDVIVLEKGPNPSFREMTQVEGDMLGSLYLDSGLIMTRSGSMPVLAGSCVGGGTTINYTTSFELPGETREEWDRISGLSLFTSRRFQDSLDRVCGRLHVGTKWSTPAPRDQILERGCRALGWHIDVIPRNVTDCREGIECGFCGYGCRHDAKQSTVRAYLRDAVAGGTRLVANCDVDRVMVERGRAVGATATVSRPDGTHVRITVRSRVVVMAAGTIYTPAILRRSGLRNRNIGRWLRLHPATAVLGFFPERVEPWSGSLQTRYSNQLADLDGGYGVRFETAPAQFALVGSAFGWEGARRFREDVRRVGSMSYIGVLLRDRDAGRVSVTRDGRPQVHYELSDYDVAHARRGVLAAAEILAAAGATEVATVQTPPVRVRVGTPGWLDRLTQAADRVGYRRCRTSYITFHQMGTARMGADPSASVVGESGRVHEVEGLYVADGSTFPASSGVNPMISIMGIADHVARGIAEGW